MRECRMVPIGANIFGIHLEPSDGNQIRGVITGCRTRNPIPFTSLSRMILLLDAQLDSEYCGTGQWKPTQYGNPTFELEILFRQNYSWQGRLRWPEKGKEATFRSVLELITLMELLLET